MDLGAPLVPPKDLFVEVRVMRELGEIVTTSGAIARLTKGSQHHLKRTDVEQFITLGYLKQI